MSIPLYGSEYETGEENNRADRNLVLVKDDEKTIEEVRKQGGMDNKIA